MAARNTFRLALLAALLSGFAHLYADTYTVKLTDSGSRNKYIDVNVDGIPAQFSFDTGCSCLSINMRLLNELVKQGKAKLSDLHSPTQAQMSNGASRMVRMLLIKRMEIGGCVFTDVVADVGMNDADDAPLLLGQSIVERWKWFSVQGCTLRFEPYDDAYQQALALAEYHWEDADKAQTVIDKLMPYFNEGKLSCFYLCKLMYVLQTQNAYSAALRVMHAIRESNCRTDFDRAEIEAHLYYNTGVEAYNTGEYEQALEANNKAQECANAIQDKQTKQKRLHDVGTLYWYIYSQLDPEKAKAYEKYEP